MTYPRFDERGYVVAQAPEHVVENKQSYLGSDFSSGRGSCGPKIGGPRVDR
jgi:hypothetical protein